MRFFDIEFKLAVFNEIYEAWKYEQGTGDHKTMTNHLPTILDSRSNI